MAGATAIEYAILVALIGLLLIVGAGRIGTSLDGIFSSVQNCLGAGTCTFGDGGGGGGGGGGGNSGGNSGGNGGGNGGGNSGGNGNSGGGGNNSGRGR